MYRGSSFILDVDYTVYSPVIKLLMHKHNRPLWDMPIASLSEQSEQINLLFELKENVIDVFHDTITYADEVASKVEATDTLITKILLGTMGCTPAYDRFFKDGCRRENVHPFSNFTVGSYWRMVEFYKKNRRKFRPLTKTSTTDGYAYPPMKFVDMYFWQIGFEEWKSKHPQARPIS